MTTGFVATNGDLTKDELFKNNGDQVLRKSTYGEMRARDQRAAGAARPARPAHALSWSRGEASAARRCPLDGYADASKGCTFAPYGAGAHVLFTKLFRSRGE
eukprot:7377970-Heterocapsa_arctica.AAC.1